ncbi:hypothetical protein BT67DRAFT_427574 [Trichocladium antarcticum]|uniref:Uncharacterized protein n=1 Tax=Trichocladium antarcticum TaxID=1450529 RepID=A0AAN6ZAV3_9PEZI|nr:hypothetical protein BT67DRAFT_427574 [Trichocladium antarcticum]
MAPPSKTAKGKARQPQARFSASGPKTSSSQNLPHPFQPAPEALQPFYATLPKSHVYITHLDPRPAAFKRKIFLVPVAMNLAVALAFAWRMAYIAPYYLDLATSALGHANATTLRAADLPYRALILAVLRRALTFLLDFVLAVFVWPWPYEFLVGTGATSPAGWRWRVGFRDQELYVRRSRASWDRVLLAAPEQPGAKAADVLDEVTGRDARDAVLRRVGNATSPMFLGQKTGYLTMDGDWDLDWAGMVAATSLVDKKVVGLEAFKHPVVLLHHERMGWITVDLGMGDSGEQEERRDQLLKFRDALTAIGKEDLFFRWVEMIQFETSQPGGFTPARQAAAAQKIRALFKEAGLDFDGFWNETVGTEGLAGMP